MIAEQLRKAELPSNSIHTKFTNLPILDYLTTNYDYMLELSYYKDFDPKSMKTSTGSSNNKYNLTNKISIKDKSFYHIHGETENVNSICLGYEHYAGSLQYLRAELNTKKERKLENLVIKQILEGKMSSTEVWAEKFFTHNISILGLSLDFNEIDLWWLITYRAYLYYSNIVGMKNLIRNSITFYDVSIKSKDNELMKHSLTNMYVNYVHIDIPDISDESYAQAYYKILDIVEQSL